MYFFSDFPIGGKYKSVDNVIIEKDQFGNEKVRFKPMPAYLIEGAMKNFCDKFNKAWDDNIFDKLLLIPMYIYIFYVYILLKMVMAECQDYLHYCCYIKQDI